MAGGAVGGAADGAARVGGGTGVAMPSDSSEESKQCWAYIGEEVALAEEGPALACCLVVPCPPLQSTNTAQRKPAGVVAGTVAPAKNFDGLERPAKLLDEAVETCAERAGGEMRSAENGAAGGTACGVVAGVVDGAGVSGSGGWTRPARICG